MRAVYVLTPADQRMAEWWGLSIHEWAALPELVAGSAS